MSSSSWVRWWHGTVTDPKFKLVAKRSNQPISLVLAVWAYLLEYASQQDDRGNIVGFNAELCAVTLDVDTDQVAAIYGGMFGLVHDAEHLTGWERRQPKREAETISTQRVREYREKKRVDTEQQPVKQHETQRNAMKHNETHLNTEEQNETARNNRKQHETTGNAPDTDKDTDTELIPPLPPKGAEGSIRYRFSEQEKAVAQWMWEKIRNVTPKAKPPNLDAWAHQVRLTLAEDKRDVAEYRRVFEWANQHPFWQTNILSPLKLREKYDVLEAKLRLDKQAFANPAASINTKWQGQQAGDVSW